MSPQYDIIIVGAGIAGSALAHALSTITSNAHPAPLRVLLLERSLAEPDRIVGELLQPGGVRALRQLGLEDCLEGFSAVPVRGYAVCMRGSVVRIPYPHGYEGRSFHHGPFVTKLRAQAMGASGVTVMQATVKELVECHVTGRVIGVRAAVTRDTNDSEGEESATTESFMADLVVVADGCFSNFRNMVMRPGQSRQPVTRSHFVGLVLEDATLPVHEHGTVALVKGHGPVLLYQIAERDTRILIDVKQPLPADLKVLTPRLLPASHLLSSLYLVAHLDKYRSSTSPRPTPARAVRLVYPTPQANA
jgi:squalene monooxygenase